MHNKVLFISDNALLCSRISEVLDRKQLAQYSFDFAVSPFSDPRHFNLAGRTVSVKDLRDEDVQQNIVKDYDLLISIHCKQLFPSFLVQHVRCINIHPGYNPHNRGWYPQVFSILNKLPAGATIHEIDMEIDHGHIIAREEVQIESFDTSLTAYNKILDKELELFESNIEALLAGDYNAFPAENEGNLNLKKDFNALLQIDLDEVMTAAAFIDRLRALTHGDYNNAYYIDPVTAKKVFVGIALRQENDGN